MKAILRQLLDRLDGIAEHHDEVGDTEVREAMSAAVSDGFIRPIATFTLPDRYAMFTEEGDRLVRQAIAEFLRAANQRATESGLGSCHARLSGFQDGRFRQKSPTIVWDR